MKKLLLWILGLFVVCALLAGIFSKEPAAVEEFVSDAQFYVFTEITLQSLIGRFWAGNNQ